ncbi:MAG: hypothetical protein JWR89_5207 [Tardiphaga sp.]|nr:hypothetical protein [Tardiphaga sp.]
MTLRDAGTHIAAARQNACRASVADRHGMSDAGRRQRRVAGVRPARDGSGAVPEARAIYHPAKNDTKWRNSYKLVRNR